MKLYDRSGLPITLLEWVELIQTGRQVADSYVKNPHGDTVRVSTVWLGLDHQFGDGPPLIFETMTFCGRDDSCRRYSTLEAAATGHLQVVEAIVAGEEP